MTRPGETTGFSAPDHVEKINETVGADFLDQVLVSNTRFTAPALAEYAKLSQQPVLPGDPKRWKELTRAKIIFSNIADEKILVRHDPQKLRKELLNAIHRA